MSHTAVSPENSQSPKPQRIYDVAVIGGGVIGCAVLRELALNGIDCVLLEKNEDIALGASGGNSGVLHVGFGTPPNTLEFKLLIDGYSRFRKLAQESLFPIKVTGALMVAWHEDEKKKLPSLVREAVSAGISDVREITIQELRKREPHISKEALGAVYIPGEAVVDPWLVPMLYAVQAAKNGAQVFTKFPIISGKFVNDEANGTYWRLHSAKDKEIHSRLVINCAGLYGDVVEKIRTKDVNFKIKPRKGQFLVYGTECSNLLRSMILPLPSPRTKGILVYRAVYDNIIIGPTAEEQESKEDLQTDNETLSMLRKQGDVIVPHLVRYKPIGSYAGIRPAVEQHDYLIEAHPSDQWVTVAGIRSTGLTSSLGIANYVIKLIEEKRLTTHLKKRRAPQKSEREIFKEARDIVTFLTTQSQQSNYKGVKIGNQTYKAGHYLHTIKGQQQQSQQTQQQSQKTAKL